MITRKIKIGEFCNYFSRSIQNIAHHSQSLFDEVTSEGGGVCMSVSRNKPRFDNRIHGRFEYRQLWVCLLAWQSWYIGRCPVEGCISMATTPWHWLNGVLEVDKALDELETILVPRLFMQGTQPGGIWQSTTSLWYSKLDAGPYFEKNQRDLDSTKGRKAVELLRQPESFPLWIYCRQWWMFWTWILWSIFQWVSPLPIKPPIIEVK